MSAAALFGAPEMGFRGLTRAEYDALVQTGVLDGAAVELIEGGVFHMAPQGPLHAGLVELLARGFTQAWRDLGETRYSVRQHSPLAAGDRSEPEPDLYVYDTDQFSLSSHPSWAHLVVEVAYSSQGRDLILKPPTYAAAGFPLLWVIDLPAREVVVHSDPDRSAGSYRLVERIPFATELSALGYTVRMADLVR